MLDDLKEMTPGIILFILGAVNVLWGNIYLVLWLFAPENPLVQIWHWSGALFNLFGGIYFLVGPLKELDVYEDLFDIGEALWLIFQTFITAVFAGSISVLKTAMGYARSVI